MHIYSPGNERSVECNTVNMELEVYKCIFYFQLIAISEAIYKYTKRNEANLLFITAEITSPAKRHGKKGHMYKQQMQEKSAE